MNFLFDTHFPDPELTDAEGLLAIGGDLSPQMLVNAYRIGAFPWFNENDPILWWCPDPRLVLFPKEVKVSKSMKQVLKKGGFTFSINQDFEGVIKACSVLRVEEGTWISPEMIDAYVQLHYLGLANSAEVWQNDALVGGLYGVQLGKVFYGESMFSVVSNASKAALIYWCLHCLSAGIELIDCQQSTAHLKSMGAKEISRKEFLSLLNQLIE
ncbi:MAG: leucyl/phenylalanyl-tRNA--protein transferase [Bacteroidetes bacterium]|jgi:leucyl/phenylalanyl-tRNA--protein transferase|nr:leucyl/phenylalanyl-tRNA--protein transferase [Bacteroidota bacterium]